MITDEEIDALAKPHCGMGGVEDYRAFAREIERISRQRQRESDAALCRDGIGIDGGRSNGKVFTYPRLAEAILANTGELSGWGNRNI